MPYDALKKQLRSLLVRLNSMLNTVLEHAPDALRKQVEDYKLAARMHLLKGTIKEEALIDDEAIFFFDDWHSSGLAERGMGEKRAFEEFLGEHPRLSAEAIGTYSFKEHLNGKIFHVSSDAVSVPPTSQ